MSKTIISVSEAAASEIQRLLEAKGLDDSAIPFQPDRETGRECSARRGSATARPARRRGETAAGPAAWLSRGDRGR